MRPEFAIFAQGITDTKILYRLIDRLSDIVKELYHNQDGAITEKVKNITPSLGAIFKYLEEKGLEPAGDASQKAYIEEIIKYLRSLPIVKITMAFEPDDTFSNRLNQVITELTGKKIVLDIEVNHHIVAGLKIEYNGKFVDYSYESKTDDFLSKKLRDLFEESNELKDQPSTVDYKEQLAT